MVEESVVVVTVVTKGGQSNHPDNKKQGMKPNRIIPFWKVGPGVEGEREGGGGGNFGWEKREEKEGVGYRGGSIVRGVGWEESEKGMGRWR